MLVTRNLIDAASALRLVHDAIGREPYEAERLSAFLVKARHRIMEAVRDIEDEIANNDDCYGS